VSVIICASSGTEGKRSVPSSLVLIAAFDLAVTLGRDACSTGGQPPSGGPSHKCQPTPGAGTPSDWSELNDVLLLLLPSSLERVYVSTGKKRSRPARLALRSGSAVSESEFECRSSSPAGSGSGPGRVAKRSCNRRDKNGGAEADNEDGDMRSQSNQIKVDDQGILGYAPPRNVLVFKYFSAPR
jgi:hypothetical protein